MLVVLSSGSTRPEPSRETDRSRGRSELVDYWTASLAGPAPWLGGRADPWQLGLGGASLVVAALAMASGTIEAVAQRSVALGVGCGALFLFFTPTLRWLQGKHSEPKADTTALFRGICLAVFVVSFGLLQSSSLAHVGLPLGLAIGIELAVTRRVIGREDLPTLSSTMGRPFHVLLAVAAVVITVVADSFGALRVLITVEAGVMASFFGLRLAERLAAGYFSEERAVEERVKRQEFEGRKHWLHDEVLVELVSLRLDTTKGRISAGEFEKELLRIEENLRELQLDQALRAEHVAVREILSPYLRRIESHNVQIGDSPDPSTGSLIVTSELGLRIRRAVAVLIGNALAAGAHTVSLFAEPGPDQWILGVFDDAPGDPQVISGRGLDSLQRDLRSVLKVERQEDGKLSRISVPVGGVL